MDNRPVTEIVLPESQAKVVLYQYLTGGQYRDIQKGLFKNTSIDASGLGVNKEERAEVLSKELLKNVPAAILFEQSELTLQFLIKEIHDQQGTKIDDHKAFVYNLTQKDSDFLYSKADELEQASRLGDEVKKK